MAQISTLHVFHYHIEILISLEGEQSSYNKVIVNLVQNVSLVNDELFLLLVL